jgi:hypothetical protein
MNNHPYPLQRLLRRAAIVLLPVPLVIIALSILASQLSEFATRNEILSLSSFIVILSFSGLAFNWCRVSPALTSETSLKTVYHVGIDLFLASLLALVASFFAWLQTIPTFIPTTFYPVLFGLHFLFLCLSLLSFLISVLCLLRVIRDEKSAGVS